MLVCVAHISCILKDYACTVSTTVNIAVFSCRVVTLWVCVCCRFMIVKGMSFARNYQALFVPFSICLDSFVHNQMLRQVHVG